MTRFTGTVLKYHAPKMYGFISADDGIGDIFYHISKVTDPALKYPSFGNRVSFGIKEDSQGRREAIQIEKVEGN